MRGKTSNLPHQGKALKALTNLLNNHLKNLDCPEALTHQIEALLDICSVNKVLLDIQEPIELTEDHEADLLNVESKILRFLLHPYEKLPAEKNVKLNAKLNNSVEGSQDVLQKCLSVIRRYHYLRDNVCSNLPAFFGNQQLFSTLLNTFLQQDALTWGVTQGYSYEKEFFLICKHFLDNPDNICRFYCELFLYQQKHRPNAEGSPRLNPIRVKEQKFSKLIEYLKYVKQTHCEHMAKLHVLNTNNPTIFGLLHRLKQSSLQTPIGTALEKIEIKAKTADCELTPANKLTTEECQGILKQCYQLELEIALLTFKLPLADQQSTSDILQAEPPGFL